MTDESPDLEAIIAVFTMPWKATHALEQLQKHGDEGSFDLIDGAVIVKDPGGDLAIQKRLDLTPGQGAKRGAMVGGILGVIFPPSLLAGVAIGAIAGATVGHLRKLGFADDYLEHLDEELNAGRTALLVVVDEDHGDEVVGAIDDYTRLDRHPVERE